MTAEEIDELGQLATQLNRLNRHIADGKNKTLCKAESIITAIANAMADNKTPPKVSDLLQTLAFKVEHNEVDGKPFATVFRQVMPYELMRDALSEVGLDIEQMKVSIR